MADAAHKRQLRNFLLDPAFQLKFAGYAVTMSLLVAALVGGVLWQTTTILFREMHNAVEVRSQLAEQSKALGEASLRDDLMKNYQDPSFEEQLKERSRSIDAAFEKEQQAILKQNQALQLRQRLILWSLMAGLALFVVGVGLASIMLTHRVAGPLFRLKRIVAAVEAGNLDVPTYPLRDRDQLKDLFDAVTRMVAGLRARRADQVGSARAALSAAQNGGASEEVQWRLEQLVREVSGQPRDGEAPASAPVAKSA